MKLTPENSGSVGVGLDHPEGLCVGPDGALFAGGEAGQVYRIDPDGTQAVIGSTDGFLLGVVLDGQGRIHACDLAKKAVFRIEPGGTVVARWWSGQGVLHRGRFCSRTSPCSTRLATSMCPTPAISTIPIPATAAS